MSLLHIRQGRTDLRLTINIVQDSGGANPGEPKTGLTNTDVTSAFYAREAGTPTAITVVSLATVTTPHTDGGFIELDGTNMPGLYRFDLPDAVVAATDLVRHATVKLILTGASNAIAEAALIDLEPRLVGELSSPLGNDDVADAVWNGSVSGHNSIGTFGQIIGGAQVGTVSGAPPATTTVVKWSGPGTLDDLYNGSIFLLRSGIGSAAASTVIDYNGATKTFTLDPPLPVAPGSGDTAYVIPASLLGLSTRRGNGLVNDASATSTSFVTDLTETATDHWKGQMLALTNGTLEGQARRIIAYNGGTKAVTVSPAFTAAPGNGDAFDLFAADGAIRDEVIAEIAAVPAKDAGLESMIKYIFMALRNKIITDSTAGDTKIHDDGGTAIGTATVADTGTVFTRGKYS